ncbi:MAG: PucR family transcriptional regulator ligand-binding domain-containing protein [Clostridium septicum]|uniref:PucR family transcriptional regulator n=1 Tax=Clostridium septicum TaxID=1504 RepID=UPI00258A588B|nr:PucR family transcriptional regulator [Clostridium septicum]MDU1312815.1 PucR family transcriptional regulator ligand-binding domain-containing protein [Clostridium septicum]WLF68747.1 PucR family transcriptional regulator ligand-binding domain-containing protein [Clostridium septicum]
MAITVEEALELQILDGFEVIAGKNGLSKKITNVAVWDYETGSLIKENFRAGDFALSTLVAIKDNIDELYGSVERMIEVGITCLAIKNIYFDYIPEEVIKLADKNDFVLMLFRDTFTEDVIVEVNKAITIKKQYENLALQIDKILYDNLNEETIKKLAYNININFKENNIVAYCKKKNNKLIGLREFSHEEMQDAYSRVIHYKGGYLVINTFNDIDSDEVENIILRRLEWLGFSQKEYVIGVSNLHYKIADLDKSIQESLYAFKHSKTYNKETSFFRKIGLNRIFIPILDNPWVQKYYNEVIEPLIQYDKSNDTELVRTAIKYIENNGDIKTTAEELFQHGNTVRYRIDKINKIISAHCKNEHFYEELAVGVRIYTLLNNPL